MFTTFMLRETFAQKVGYTFVHTLTYNMSYKKAYNRRLRVMKKMKLKKVFVGTLAALIITGSMGIPIQKVSAMENAQDEQIEDDEVMIKGGDSSYYILNKNYSTFYAEDFMDVVYKRVGERVKIWDVENNLKEDLNVLRKQCIKNHEGYHLMTNEERNDLAEAARLENITLKQLLMNAGIDLSYTSDYLTTACGGPNRVWHYSDVRWGYAMAERSLYFEKFNISTNHIDNSLVGNIYCSTEDHDRFMIPFGHSDNWKFIFKNNDHIDEFVNINYLLLYVKD